MLDCGGCGAGESCSQNQCIPIVSTDAGTPDSGHPADAGHPADSGVHHDAGGDASSNPDAGEGDTGDNGGCGCRTVESTSNSAPAIAGTFGVLLLAGARVRRRRNK